ncbi:MAG: hypothetical protein A2Z21_10775 [Candidatus Fraserbacteria bacterium RBG_16_55_9]|uniref:Dihydrolipoamide acetyltransferase component of pyruvate dehydrogenase complex n=1 Tax=Fraserbacteria sp. (strain RBG_16_55_9) TaxID=1817864 RepID=A0A1F5V2F5_FRAXR|nr:MAG: hypothetical protein A2Z21_10775 [Candidatus Fraserbacteria bacterium RBG_16_55_9]
MAVEFKLPDIGEGVHEGEIVKWLVKEGDALKEDQPMVEVMTDKATVEIPSPSAGKVLQIYVKEGEVVKVGSVLVVIGKEGEQPKQDGRKVEAATQPSGDERGSKVKMAETAAMTTLPKGRVLATPATRKLARELSVDLAQVQGTGPGGRVTDEDVRGFTERKEAVPTRTAVGSAPAPAAERPAPVAPLRRVMGDELEDRIPMRGIRKRISDHMHHAKTTAAHFTYVDEVDVTELVKVRDELKALVEKQGVKLTFLPFILRACVASLKKHPYLNASIDHEKGEIVLKHYYNIGIATATEEGLIVPVVKAADLLSILEMAQEIERLAAKARERKITVEELQGGTFTITSLGAAGGLFATPIVNSPESAILGIHEIKKRPVVIDNEIKIRDIMLIALSFDHRLIDGHVGAAFAKDVKAFLEDPKWLLVGA